MLMRPHDRYSGKHKSRNTKILISPNKKSDGKHIYISIRKVALHLTPRPLLQNSSWITFRFSNVAVIRPLGITIDLGDWVAALFEISNMAGAT